MEFARASGCIVSLILASFFLVVVQAADCTDEWTKFLVYTSADADELMEGLMCAKLAHITVVWRGRVKLSKTLTVGNGSSLHIVGSEAAVVDGGGLVPLFTFSDGATANLTNLSFENGFVADNGGAISVVNSTVVFDTCNFSNSTAMGDGGEFLLYFELMTRFAHFT